MKSAPKSPLDDEQRPALSPDTAGQPNPNRKPRPPRGRSSFAMQDSSLVLDTLEVRPGQTILDLGCGPGDYTLALAGLAGSKGVVHALDARPAAIGLLKRQMKERGGKAAAPVLPRVFELPAPLPLETSSVDLCVMFTVLHVLARTMGGSEFAPELARVLKPGGRLAVLECKKEKCSWGPPEHLRLSPSQVRGLIEPHGFKACGKLDLGLTYLTLFQRT